MECSVHRCLESWCSWSLQSSTLDQYFKSVSGTNVLMVAVAALCLAASVARNVAYSTVDLVPPVVPEPEP